MNVIAIVLTILAALGWNWLIYRLITRKPEQFMSTPYRLILVVAGSLTFLLFVHDYRYDKPSAPYSSMDYVGEILIIGGMYTAVFFFLFSGIYLFYKKLFSYSGKI
jgi:hypothetical protein